MTHPGLQRTGMVLGHSAVTIAGVVLMLVGLGLGVTISLLPLGLPIGLLGFGMVGWAIFE
ncbi:MAG: hypothetical protein ACYTGG_14265 [Planctomycetota bacterium]|jgi:hypothetical protein